METNRIIELLKIEHECMLKGSHGDCDRKCEDCELVQDDWELHEMYTDAISLLKKYEPMKPTWNCGRAYCRNCGHKLPRKSHDFERHFCSNCGQKVEWNG